MAGRKPAQETCDRIKHKVAHDQFTERYRSVVSGAVAQADVHGVVVEAPGNCRAAQRGTTLVAPQPGQQKHRTAEFRDKSGGPSSAVLAVLGATMNEASAVFSRLTEEDLLAPYEIQGYRVTGLEAVYHVVEHFGMHYGQIIYIAKALQGKDLGFYRELDQTGRAS
jgi:hypothetical protein